MSDNRTLTANFQKTFTDSRDGRMYRTVVMPDGKTWMSENLNYVNNSWSHNGVTGSIPLSGVKGSWCYGNNSSNCGTYGRLYTWEAALEACPAGWRLPTQQDWTDLCNATGGVSAAGTKLKAKSPAWDGTDDFGFSALPGGFRITDGSFWNVGGWGFWWAATEGGSDIAHRRNMGSGGAYVYVGWDGKSDGFSVRCLRDRSGHGYAVPAACNRKATGV